MIQSLAMELQALTLQQASTSGSPEQASAEGPSPRLVGENLDRVTVILRYSEPRYSRNEGGEATATVSPALESIQAMWGVFEAIVKVYRTNNDVLEKVSCGSEDKRSVDHRP